ncbi:MAG: Cobalt-zinc-cadmium resistance protein CzcB [Pseudomonas fluorescens]|nr:MAG: Cobalt-zinc-cadmium resistance protein CzcB [Pseudomonas fluorescens]
MTIALSALSGSNQLTGGNRYELRAPFDGVVVEKHLGVGEVVSETTNAFILSDLSRVWVTFGVFPKDLNKVRVGKPVTVSSPELGAQVQGTVAYVGSLLGEQTRSATVRVTVANPDDAWRPGLFVSVQVATDTRPVEVAVAQAAIQTVEDKPTVFVRTADGLMTRHIETGTQENGYVEVRQGLAAGEQVATTGSFILKSELGKATAEHAH